LIVDRREALTRVLANPAWRKFVHALRGTDAILDRFFPPFISAIPRMSAKTKTALSKLGYTAPTSLAGASDKELLAVSGVGPALVKAIRVAVANAPDPEARFLDRVLR